MLSGVLDVFRLLPAVAGMVVCCAADACYALQFVRSTCTRTRLLFGATPPSSAKLPSLPRLTSPVQLSKCLQIESCTLLTCAYPRMAPNPIGFAQDGPILVRRD
ncbi:hypothetical protein AAT19DRAFT_13936 [Rhodotorula toruloides]|uniref:Secreted protein n=1 Tax=Rhodotorula toruloides TaxID=5286 RepID=A0A2T0AA77_RHOTO|nr:hypothetical protein AAT19DRAFT_13936 [Rhodotorula toruloides]